ncbi:MULTISPECIES: hypothetical protein [Catenuloplanes]|uniref:Uncharacterized protein n=1 Tax=Catenuloplanes niger TaxID=587534 RepID=A0AAE4CVK8_9ACTN|nr:hypothetical protein [Catenuloplanes niger]MDR7327491.1 hypothetical protein [Catenuloplanes niger]
MGAFIAFLDAPADQRLSLVTAMAEDYSPARDPYRQIRHAIRCGRRMGKDELAMQGVLDSCARRWKQHYQEIAEGWLRYVASCGSDTITDLPTGRWHTCDLAVKVTPDLAVRRADGSYDAIKLYMKAEPPTSQAAGATLWLLQQAMTQCFRGARPVLLDVRRSTPHTTLPGRAGFQTWLESEAASLAHLQQRRPAA